MEPLWWLTRDGDPFAYEMARRHYSAWKNRKPKQRLFVGPGEKVVLRTEDGRAFWAWRWAKYRKDRQVGVECSHFRNESPNPSSILIRQACGIADAIWPDQRRFTFIDSKKVASKNPGYCFKLAGWKLVRDECGKPVLTKKGLLILEYP
jgi:hypothetical protein